MLLLPQSHLWITLSVRHNVVWVRGCVDGEAKYDVTTQGLNNVKDLFCNRTLREISGVDESCPASTHSWFTRSVL